MRKKAQEAIDSFFASRRVNPTDEERGKIFAIVDLFFEYANKEFPKGAIIKNYSDRETGDDGNLIRTFKETPELLVEKFIEALVDVKRKSGKKLTFDDELTVESAMEWTYITSNLFIFSIIAREKRVLVQEKLELAELDGASAEVRVDFVNGLAINATPRYTFAYMPEQLEQAEQYVSDVLSRLPDERRDLSGGVDIPFGK